MVSRRLCFDRDEDREGSKETPSLVERRHGIQEEREREKNIENYKSERERERES